MTGKLRALVCSHPMGMSENKEWGRIGSTAASPNPWLHSYLQTDRENITRPQDALVGRAMLQKVLPVYHHGGRSSCPLLGLRPKRMCRGQGWPGRVRTEGVATYSHQLGPLSAGDISSQGMAIRVELTACLKMLCVWLSIGMAA